MCRLDLLGSEQGSVAVGFLYTQLQTPAFHLRRENPTSSMTTTSLRNQFHAVRRNLPTPMMTKQAVSELREEISFGWGLGCLPHSYFQRRTQSH